MAAERLSKLRGREYDARVARKPLNDKLDCKACGTIQMDIPDNTTENTPILCSNCGAFLGTWGELQDDFARQIKGASVLDLDKGTIVKKS